MQFQTVLCLLLIGTFSLASSSDSGCGENINFNCCEEDELSLVETVLLFPLSITDTIPPPKDCDSGFGFSDIKQWGRWLLDAGAAVRAHVPRSARKLGAWLSERTWAFVGVVSATVDGIEAQLEKLEALLHSIKYQELLCSVLGCVHLSLDAVTSCPGALVAFIQQPTWPDSHATTVRYVVAATLAVSLIPLLIWNGKVGFRRSKEDGTQTQNIPRSKRYLEQDETSSLRKFYVHPLSPVLESSLEGSNSPIKRRKLTNKCGQPSPKGGLQSHYLMCESFDRLPCNCGGKQASPARLDCSNTVNGSPTGVIFTGNLFTARENDPDRVVYTEHIVKNKRDQTTDKVLYTELIYPNKKDRSPDRQSDTGFPSPTKRTTTAGTHRDSRSYRKRSTSPRKKLHLVIGEHLPDHVMKTASDDVSSRGPSHVTSADQSGNSLAPPQQHGTLELYEREAGGSELDMSFASDIGDPCFNSSFKEESLYVIQDGDTGAVGDGPAIITRRSPRKELGMSFERSRSNSVASQCDEMSTFEETRGTEDGTADEYGESPPMDFSNSMSFVETGGGGLVEFAVILAVEGVYRWSKRFLRNRSKPQPSDEPSSVNNSANSRSSWFSRSTKDYVDPSVAECNVSANAIETDVDTGHSNYSSFVDVASDGMADNHRLSGGDGLYCRARESSVDANDFENDRHSPTEPIDFGNQLKNVRESSVDPIDRGARYKSPLSNELAGIEVRCRSPRSMEISVDPTDFEDRCNSPSVKEISEDPIDFIVPCKSPRSSGVSSEPTDFIVVRYKSPRSRDSSPAPISSEARCDRPRSRGSSFVQIENEARPRGKAVLERPIKYLNQTEKTDVQAHRLKYGRTDRRSSRNPTRDESDSYWKENSKRDALPTRSYSPSIDINYSNNSAAVLAEMAESTREPVPGNEMSADDNKAAESCGEGVEETVEAMIEDVVEDVGYLADLETSASLEDMRPECDRHQAVVTERRLFQELDDVD